MGKILSLIIPSYNMEAYLPKCLGSLVVEPELMEKLEVLVVNDGSKDRTSAIAHEFATKYPATFQVIDKANGHYGSCINSALKIATGEYVKVLDADDSFDTMHFAEYLRFLQGIRVDVVLNAYRTIAKDGSVIYHNLFDLPKEETFGIEAIGKCAQNVYMHGLAYRLKLLKDIHYCQMEGCPYTDGEWVALPMLAVRSCSYFASEVYVYLNGREGQSIGRDAQRKGFRVMANIFRDIAEKKKNFACLIADPNERFFLAWVEGYARMVVGIAVAVLPSLGFGRQFRFWDEFYKKEYPEQHFKVCKRLVSNKIRFDYLAFISCHYWAGDFVIALVRMLQCVLRTSVVRWIMRRRNTYEV